MSNRTDTVLINKYCDEATVYVSAVVVAGNPTITVRIVPKEGNGVVTILSDSVATVQGAAMVGLLDTLRQQPWKDTT